LKNKNSQGKIMNEQKKCEEILSAIAEELPPVVFRNWNRWRDVLPMSPRSVANDDCLGKGPAERVYVGRNAGYPRAAFLDYLKKRTRLSGGEE
jgi:hypothetical protein